MSQIKNNCVKLVQLIKAKAPFIYIADADETNTIKAVHKTMLSLVLNMQRKRNFNVEEGFKYFEWSCNTGLQRGQISVYKNEGKDTKSTAWNNIISDAEEDKVINFPQGSSSNENTKDILEALQSFVMEKPQSSKNENIFVMVIKDPQLFLQNNPMVTRRMREIIMNANKSEAHKNLTRHIVILSPVKKVPVDLEVYANYIDWKLPDAEDIKAFTIDLGELEVVADDAAKQKKIKAAKQQDDSKYIYTEAEMKQIVNALIGLPMCRIEEHLCVCYSYKGKVLDPKFLYQLKTKYILENSSLELMDTSIPMGDVGGMDKFKEWINQRINAFTDDAVAFGIEPPKGVLLVGIQGCGKSLMAKALASLWGLPLVRFDVAKVFSKTIGSSEENIRNTLTTVEALAPCIVMIDEIEKGLAGVASSNFSDSGTTARVVGTLLSWMNDRQSQTFIVATANDVSQLPPELLRKGRFDELFFCALPQHQERKTIFEIHLKKRGHDPKNFNTECLAEKSENYSGAEIEQVVKNALLIAFNSKEKLTTAHLEQSIVEIIPLFATSKEEVQGLLEWVGWDDSRKEGLRARFASEEGKRVHGATGGKLPDNFGGKKKGVIDASTPKN